VSRLARKRFGQNFLVDRAVIRRIIDTIGPVAGELLIEIGPGHGAITTPLLDSGAELMVVEIDRDLAMALQQRYSQQPLLTIRQADALQTDFGELAGGRPYRLVGNLPYNISTPLVFHVLGLAQPPLDMHFMLQKEVVERLAAAPGGKDYGRLGVMCQNRCEVTPLFTIGPDAFEPAPRVESMFVRLRPRGEPVSGHALLDPLDRVVRAAFSKRRKTLRNSLAGLLTEAQMTEVDIDPGLRAEQLSLEDFIQLARLVSLHGKLGR
jgi:16S rRNA (adenine1518-N6/adenine1519-N6)-dimethyltransferase